MPFKYFIMTSFNRLREKIISYLLCNFIIRMQRKSFRGADGGFD